MESMSEDAKFPQYSATISGDARIPPPLYVIGTMAKGVTGGADSLAGRTFLTSPFFAGRYFTLFSLLLTFPIINVLYCFHIRRDFSCHSVTLFCQARSYSTGCWLVVSFSSARTAKRFPSRCFTAHIPKRLEKNLYPADPANIGRLHQKD